MTPIEKANELLRKLKLATTFKYQEYAGANYSTFEHDDEQLINCAIICVDEIIDAFISGGRDSFELQNMDKELRFWYEVKDELNRMKS